ncbi:hypothetical protein [Noviherbaspirillum denitrificans]|nr:hypothetical protein [Noviherbaspirillum denitrificans]
MDLTSTDEVNRLICDFTTLQESWEANPGNFDWPRLEALARDGARAYNEGAGPSFHALALDGVEHSAFHERFLGYLLQAGFDPFHLARPGSGVAPVPVIDHASLADAAFANPSSARMRTMLMAIARERFAGMEEEVCASGRISAESMLTVEACAESIPPDLLQRIAPELVEPQRSGPRQRTVDPIEGYLSPAEIIVEGGHAPYG